MMNQEFSKYNLIDRVTRANQQLSTDHSLIHAGRGFSVFTYNAALDNAAYLSIALKSSADKYLHLKAYEPWFNGDYGVFSIIEGCTISGGASSGHNRNRTSGYLGSTEIKTGVTISGGNEIESLYVGGGSIGSNSTSGIRSLDIEWVLKPDTQYVLKLLNTAGGAKKANIWCFFYEEEDG